MEKLKLFLTEHKSQAIAFSLVILLLLSSVTFLGAIFTNPNTYRKTIQSIDDKKLAVLGVSSAIASSATLLASFPDDATTPLAEEMMDLSSLLVLVVCVLVLEKSLLTVFGAAACYILLPTACVFALVYILKKNTFFATWAIRFFVLALAFLLLVPSAMMLSDYIYDVNQVTVEPEDDETENTNPSTDDPWYKKLWSGITTAIESTVEKALDKGKQALNKFTDAVTVFIIAYCAIPIFIVFLLLWLLKILFRINIDMDSLYSKFFKHKRVAKNEIET